jgi:hypothetical protein
LRYSLKRYGPDAADRYRLLLIAAIETIANDPFCLASTPILSKHSMRAYSLAHSRLKASTGQPVQRPAHKLVYRVDDGGIVDILAIVGLSYPASRVRSPKS